MKQYTIVLLLAVCGVALAATGIDISRDTCNSIGGSGSVWSCLISNGISFAVVEAWNGGFGYGSNTAACVSGAWNAGFAHVDVYAFMCNQCNNDPKQSISTLVQDLQADSVQFGTLWMDVEQCSGCWSDTASSCNFVEEAVAQAQSMGITVGVYSSSYEWGATVGSSCTSLSNLPLWYAHYDGQANFNDAWAYQFGGWTSPSMKQYADSGPCTSVDVSWYPDDMQDHFASLSNRTKRA